MWVICFFFFKQKTAYEMRISDWSSDVCSSDLQISVAKAVVVGEIGGRRRPTAAVPIAGRGADHPPEIADAPGDEAGIGQPGDAHHHVVPLLHPLDEAVVEGKVDL